MVQPTKATESRQVHGYKIMSNLNTQTKILQFITDQTGRKKNPWQSWYCIK